ncbi:MAG: RraA family protein [Candidatus Dormiibacterota bacterium]
MTVDQEVTPLDPGILEALARYDSPTISNAIETFDVRPRDEGFMGHEIRCMFPDLGPLVAYAATGTIRSRGKANADSEPLFTHIGTLPGPRVVVLQDLDDEPAHGAFWGEVMANTFTALECLGTVTNGCVRDLKEAHEVGFQFFAGSIGVSHAYVRLESAGGPVTVGGLVVRPGDLLHADQHGVVSVPREIAAEVPAAADRVIAGEQEFIRWVRGPEFDAQKLAEMRRVRH